MLADEVVSKAEPVAAVAEAVKSLTAFADALEKDAIQHESDAQGIDRVALQMRKVELEAKKWVSQQAIAARAEIMRLKQYKQYEDWKSLGQLQRRVAQVRRSLREGHHKRLCCPLQTRVAGPGCHAYQGRIGEDQSRKGKVLHRLQLKGVKGKQTLDKVLSEGERRIVALAAYLADLTEKPNNAPFIFDDPISSLDQTWRSGPSIGWSSSVKRAKSLSLLTA